MSFLLRMCLLATHIILLVVIRRNTWLSFCLQKTLAKTQSQQFSVFQACQRSKDPEINQLCVKLDFWFWTHQHHLRQQTFLCTGMHLKISGLICSLLDNAQCEMSFLYSFFCFLPHTVSIMFVMVENSQKKF